MVIGLTGGIASGKSTVSAKLKELGAAVIDADLLARDVVRKGEIAYNKIVQCFGADILLPGGDIDRKKLGDIVFSDKEKLELLNSITHPEIINRMKERIQELKAEGAKVIVVDAAILIEMGLHKYVDSVWVLSVDRETQLKRLAERDKYDYREAENRINSQFTDEVRKKYADVVIDNSKPIEEVEKRLEELWNNIAGGE
ncbi:MAG TPA: dephospho-CoA kinase [Bacillota bacterium]|nr:dephospho-CoA kinase [Bacillota bacterium]HNT02163.1 dephospho-CoA kinase [Bacillota bacterium]HPA53963.1 dephospho-CoA kinase [Bacillota bacterium]HPX69862.1 dephospho-CoA kinase [Bacillota bacterium]HQA66385.1 dephospho-CoA kinase [Bacillota bacterium]